MNDYNISIKGFEIKLEDFIRSQEEISGHYKKEILATMITKWG